MTGGAVERVRCRDCTAAVDDIGRLDHDLTCPRGLDMEATGADDARWFREHPDQAVRRRPLRWSEAELLAGNDDLPEGYTYAGIVSVRQLTPRLWTRSFNELWAVRKDGDG